MVERMPMRRSGGVDRRRAVVRGQLSRSGMAAGLLAAAHVAGRGLRGVLAPLATVD